MWGGLYLFNDRPSLHAQRMEFAQRLREPVGRHLPHHRPARVSDKNPLLWAPRYAAAAARSSRAPRRDDNVGKQAEALGSQWIAAALDLYRDLRDAAAEAAFFQVYGLNVADQQRVIRRASRFDPRTLPAVRQVLDTIEQGSAHEAFVRIALMMTKSGRDKRNLAQMQYVKDLLAPTHTLDNVDEDALRALLHEETIVIEFEPERAKRALPRMSRTPAERRQAHAPLDVVGGHFPLEERQRSLAAEIRALLPLPAFIPRKVAASRKPKRKTRPKA